MASGSSESKKKWCMYPGLHADVSRLLEENDLQFSFHDVDDPSTSTRSYNTNIMGRFTCTNTACKSKGWPSKIIAATIRMYPRQKYNARVYFQHCKKCNSSSKPLLDESYAQRVAYRLKKWSGIDMPVPTYSGETDGPHNTALCEGCKADVCGR